jgi:Fe-S cluster assembly ATP-binding protein
MEMVKMKPANHEIDSLEISDLKVCIKDKLIVKGVTLTVEPGTVHALMGPNGTGKSSLALALMGHPGYDVEGSARIGGLELLDLVPDERARAGLFLAMQYPAEIPGVPMADFIRTAQTSLGKKKKSRTAFRKNLEQELKATGLDPVFATRYLNEGFSGGEKKRSELVQARMLEPKFAIFDEIDSGLDIDALKAVAQGINELRRAGTGVLIITHYRRILDHLQPDHVHIMSDGRIVRSAPGLQLAEALEKGGYEAVLQQEGALS